jgi:hypothetical protein
VEDSLPRIVSFFDQVEFSCLRVRIGRLGPVHENCRPGVAIYRLKQGLCLRWRWRWRWIHFCLGDGIDHQRRDHIVRFWEVFALIEPSPIGKRHRHVKSESLPCEVRMLPYLCHGLRNMAGNPIESQQIPVCASTYPYSPEHTDIRQEILGQFLADGRKGCERSVSILVGRRYLLIPRTDLIPCN